MVGITTPLPHGPGAPVPGRVLLLGASGTIGRATAEALLRRGYRLTSLSRTGRRTASDAPPAHPDWVRREVEFDDVSHILAHGIRGEPFDVVISCMASRNGTPGDAWAVDHQAHLNVLRAAQAAGIGHLVLLSAICVQRPRLVFQQAKLAFERELIASGLRYTIVRPTAFFKSLSGQVERVRQGRPVLLFGDGRRTACKPISDRDLAEFIADCLNDPARWNRILPIGGPGPAQTPREQAEALFARAGRPPRFRHVPVALMDLIIGVLSVCAWVSPRMADQAERARIGRYYATESMLCWDPVLGRYDAEATPSVGRDRLIDYQMDLLEGRASLDRGEHAVF